MRIEVKKFGEILVSRPAGKEAYLVFESYLKPGDSKEIIELDFTGVKVLTPSWIDEFLKGLKAKYGERVRCLPSDNPSVVESLKAIE